MRGKWPQTSNNRGTSGLLVRPLLTGDCSTIGSLDSDMTTFKPPVGKVLTLYLPTNMLCSARNL